MKIGIVTSCWGTLLGIACLVVPVAASALTYDFEDLPVPAEGYWNGSDGTGGFESEWVSFGNSFDDTWGSWEGFAYSQVTDTNTVGYENQYAVWTPGVGLEGTGTTYAVVYPSQSSEITFPFAAAVNGFYVNNTTYAALDMLNGSDFSKQFEAGDWFLLTVTGYDADGQALGAVEQYLADYRSSDPADWYILGDWTWLDLRELGPGVKQLTFALSSSDVGDWGMNTPNYFAMDGLVVTPVASWQGVDFEDVPVPAEGYWNGSDGTGGFESEWVSFGNSFDDTWGSWEGFAYSQVTDTNTVGYENQYAVWTPGVGLEGTGTTYAVVYPSQSSEITFPVAATVEGFYVNNTTYAALDMLNGSDFSKQFEAGDWFLLTVTGYDADGQALGAVEQYLADYRSSEPADWYILGDWTWLDLRELGPGVKQLTFALSSSDVGDWGMNTPNYFALDGLRWMPGYSSSLGSTNLFDAGVPGFVGPDGDGVSDGTNNMRNPAFAGWAAEVVEYAPAAGLTSDWTNHVNALGPVAADNVTLVSLGEATNGTAPGSITLRMSTPIGDENGHDFVVFENAFGSSTNVFGELAFVEVSTDGTNFVRFPSISLTPAAVGAFASDVDPRNVHGLAGKHINQSGQSWGTPFDLASLASDPHVTNGVVDLQYIEYVRIVDVPGDGTYLDSLGHPIYDPYETSGSGGFDLDAVGVLHSPYYHRVQTVATGPGGISPYGQPDGVVAVADGSNLTFTITPETGQHIKDVRVDGVSIGVTGVVEMAAVGQDRVLEADFGSRLTVSSAYGLPAPAVGMHVGYGPMTLRMPEPVVAHGTTQYVCIGWTDGAGDVAATGAATEVDIDLRSESAITWRWTTNYWAEVVATGEGHVDTNSSWQAAGSTLTLRAMPDPWFVFEGWQGDLQGGDSTNAQIAVQLDSALSLTAVFGAETLTSQRVPGTWLSHYGFWDGESSIEDAALKVDPATGMTAADAFYAGVMPGDTNTLFRILDMGTSGGDTYVTWYGGTNGSMRPFVVETRASLDPDGAWVPVEGSVDRSGDGTNTWWSSENVSNLYYRITVPTGE